MLNKCQMNVKWIWNECQINPFRIDGGVILWMGILPRGWLIDPMCNFGNSDYCKVYAIDSKLPCWGGAPFKANVLWCPVEIKGSLIFFVKYLLVYQTKWPPWDGDSDGQCEEGA